MLKIFSLFSRKSKPEGLIKPQAVQKPVPLPQTLSAMAPAKLNLALHVTGQRAGGYHELDSIVAFASIGDEISVLPSQTLSLQVSGPFGHAVPSGPENLVLRAAEVLRQVRGVEKGATIRLSKMLPTAAGLGGGSADAAATLKLLARYWDVEPLPAEHPEVIALGADVPVCLSAPKAQRMRGIGEILSPLPPLPRCGLVLVNPRVEVSTPEVFKVLEKKNNAPLAEDMPSGLEFESFVSWLQNQRNDLQAPAEELAPEITEALALLRKTPGISHAVMSGSGATCIGFCKDMGVARNAARALQVQRQGWWVSPAQLQS